MVVGTGSIHRDTEPLPLPLKSMKRLRKLLLKWANLDVGAWPWPAGFERCAEGIQ